MTRRKILQLAGAAAAVAQTGLAAPYEPAAANLTSRRWFQDAKFGMFIHWGIYSVLGNGEWVMQNTKMPIAEYEKLGPQFNPVKYDPAQWVQVAKSAGMRYITITSKHHDGFAMFGTKQHKWNIVDATPYGKDVLKPLAEECRKAGLRLFFYHSHLDWHHADYFPLGRTGQFSGRAPGGDFNRYLDFMDAQLTELLTGYGDIAGIWFDGIWDKPQADWRLRQTYDLIHRLQPGALVGNNHHLTPFEGEDFQMFERDLPGQNNAGMSGNAKIGSLPLESCDTMNGAWGYNASDKKFKTTQQLIQYLTRAAGNNGNFLLNVGPRPDGTIQEEFVTGLGNMGAWLAKNGESVYGTRGGPIAPRPWGVTTAKGKTVYLHIHDWPDELLAIPRLPTPVVSARLLATGRPVTVRETDGGLLLTVPAGQRDAVDTVVAMETR